jgi:LPS-assembly protein
MKLTQKSRLISWLHLIKNNINQLAKLLAISIIAHSPVTLADTLDKHIRFEADNVVVDHQDNSLIATGKVRLERAGETLTADKMTYKKNEKKALAEGNVVHKNAVGTITYAKKMELDTEFSQILAETLITRFSDGLWIGADNAITEAGDKSVFKNTRFTPCKCNFMTGETPLWDIKAKQTIRNEKTQTITHTNMIMRVMNVPVGYFPLMSHPDWTVRRKSGFLTPSFLVSSDLGMSLSVPYYHIIDDTSDIELTGYNYQNRGMAIKSRYRKLWDNAEINATIYSANVETYKKHRELVGASDVSFGSRIGNGWNVAARLRRTSQDTFMRRYNFNEETSLKSEIIASRVVDNRFYLVEASDRQALTTTDSDLNEPTLLPSVYYEKTQTAWRPKQQMRTELHALQLDNDQGYDLARWTGAIELSEEFRVPFGVASYEANATGYYYVMHNNPETATTSIGDVGFLTPSLSIGWRLPFAAITDHRNAIIEPQAKLIYVGGDNHTEKVPNRDAADYRIDEANLFLLNNYQGKDYVLPGTRVDIGLAAVTKDEWAGRVTGFVGLSRRLAGKPSSGLNAGQYNKYSDLVSSLSINPANSFNLTWAGRIAPNDFTLNESQTTVSSTFGKGHLQLSHNQLTKAYFANSDDDREELSATYRQTLAGGWSLSATQLWDLSNSGSERGKTRASLVWNGGNQDCLTATINYERDPVADRDISAVDNLNFTIYFKNLGAISQSALGALAN